MFIYTYMWLEGDREEENEKREAWMHTVEANDI